MTSVEIFLIFSKNTYSDFFWST